MVTELILFLALSLRNDETEKELYLRIRQGDKDAFREFYNLHQGPLFSFLRSKGLDSEDAGDLIQQAFLIIWEKRASIDPDRSLRSFLFTTAYNRMLNHFRDKKSGEPEFAYKLEHGGQNPHEKTETSEAMKRLQAALEAMPEKRRCVFELCYLQGFSYKEAAETMNVSPKTIENHMALALKELREALKHFF
jgi:RNA polymerase sigma-70 factor, ECF subfamily